MTRSRIAVLAVVAVLAAVAIVVLVQRGGGDRRRAGAPDAAPAGGAQPGPDVAPRAAASGGAGEAPPAGGPLRLEDDPEGSLRLEGQVIDADERPVAGATVAISSVPRRTAQSERDGSFVFDRLVGRAYHVEAHHGDEGHAGPVTVRLTGRTEPVILRMRPAATVEVAVVDGRARGPVGGAAVEIRGLVTLTATAGADGKATVRHVSAGWHVAHAAAPGHAPAWQLFEVPDAPAAVERVTIALERGAPVAGVVHDPQGRPVAGARVTVRAPGLLDLADERDDAVVSDATGRWRLPAVAAGTFRFAASHERYAPGLSGPVTLDGATERAGVVIALEAGARIAGRVVSTDGAPVPQATVRVAATERTFLGGGVRQAICDDRGAFALDGLARRPARAIALHEEAASSPLDLDLAARPEQTGLELVLDVKGAIGGVVVTSAGEPVPEAQVVGVPMLEELGDDDLTGLRGMPRDVADSGGRFRLGGLRPGAYRILAGWPGATEERMWLRAGVSAKVGDEAVRVVLDPDGRVKGKVVYADGTSPELFAIAVGSAGAARPFSGTGGAFTIDGVPPGERLLTVTGPAVVRKLVEAQVPAGGEVDVGTITVERGRSVSGRVLAQDGTPVAGARVFGGKQLLGDGAKLDPPFGVGGRLGIKETTSGDDGAYALSGIGEGPLVLAADHPEQGRSPTVSVPPGKNSAQVDLVVVAPGSLAGKVLQAGKPVSGVMVTATAQAASQGAFLVTTGADGGYRLERLAPDTYVITAMQRGGGLGMRMESVLAVVEPGKTTERDLELPTGGVTLTVQVTADRAPVQTAQVLLLSGTVTATTGGQLNQLAGERGAGSLGTGFVLKGAPAKLENVTPGAYSVCVIVIGVDMNDPAALQRLQESVDTLPVTCVPRTIPEAPANQDITVEVPPAPAGGDPKPPTKGGAR